MNKSIVRDQDSFECHDCGEQIDKWSSSVWPSFTAAAALGKKGGKARADAMTPERRAEIAKRAAKKRWSGS
jgi:hypothetical protein